MAHGGFLKNEANSYYLHYRSNEEVDCDKYCQQDHNCNQYTYITRFETCLLYNYSASLNYEFDNYKSKNNLSSFKTKAMNRGFKTNIFSFQKISFFSFSLAFLINVIY